jgi:hypothetical protein
MGWRAGVYPRSADLPILYRNEVQTSDQDEAVIEAMDRIDRCSGTRRFYSRLGPG